MSRPMTDNKIIEQSFPRVSGDEPPGVHVIVTALEFSPRERG